MLYVFLKGHDYKYEVAELIKLFTSEFKFKDSNANNNIEYYSQVLNTMKMET